MHQTEVITFRCAPPVREKLFALATGMNTSAANVIKQLIEDAPVQPVQVPGLTLVQKNNSRAQVVRGQSATAVEA